MQLRAAFKDNGWGARPAGMGGAFTAVADDANAALYNPAGIMQLKIPEANFMYSKLYYGLDNVSLGLNYLSYVYPTVSKGAFGINWANFRATDLYREDTFTFTYASSLNDFNEELKNEYLFGANLKYLRNSFTLDTRSSSDPVFAGGRSATAIALDAGFLVNFYEESIGLSILNINEPDIGLKTKELIHREYRLGFASMLGRIWKLEEALFSADLSYRDSFLEYHIGWENWFARRTFALRFGTNKDEVDMGFGYVQTVGGLQLEFDYALLWSMEIDENMGSHRASVTMRFGGAPDKKKKETVSGLDDEMVKKAREIIKNGEIKIDKRGLIVNLSSFVLFDFGKSVLKARSVKLFDEITELLRAYKKNNIIIEGHTDSIGTHIFNKRLSKARARAVLEYLKDNGINEDRISVVGQGESNPIADNSTAQGRTENRRVEIIIYKP